MALGSRVASAFRRRIAELNDQDIRAYGVIERKLAREPRYTPGCVRARNWTLHYLDAGSVLSAFRTVVVQRWNDFQSSRLDPRILDCGANIGIATIHYKRLFPDARITAFEPDPETCELLSRNLAENGITDVEVCNAAAWTFDGTVSFLSDGADAGRVIEDPAITQCYHSLPKTAALREVATVRLARVIEERGAEFIKMDIEGAEGIVVPDCSVALRGVNSMIIEYHLQNSDPKPLSSVLIALESAGFHVSINSYGRWVDLRHPARSEDSPLEADQNLLIACWRETTTVVGGR